MKPAREPATPKRRRDYRTRKRDKKNGLLDAGRRRRCEALGSHRFSRARRRMGALPPEEAEAEQEHLRSAPARCLVAGEREHTAGRIAEKLRFGEGIVANRSMQNARFDEAE